MSYKNNKTDCMLVNTITGKVFFKGFLNRNTIDRWLTRKNAAIKIWSYKASQYVDYWGGSLNE